MSHPATVPVAYDAGPMGPATDSVGERATRSMPDPFREVLRRLKPLVGEAAVQAAGYGIALERSQRGGDPPTVASCHPLEPNGAYPVADAHSVGISAFLDGIQRSRVVGHLDGTPLVFGTVAAAVRVRRDRQLATWGEPRIRSAVYGARPQLGEQRWTQLADAGVEVVDICAGAHSAAGTAEGVWPHPIAVRARALELIALERETVERHLAADWCRSMHEWLWIDGGVSGNLAVDDTACAFGVVKSHTTLYGDPATIRTVLGLRAGQRSAVFLAGHRPRRAVASWYLRLRECADGDPLHGLVRVEVAPAPAITDAVSNERSPAASALDALTASADRLSGWILAERAPLSRPDARWDTLTYGVYACEQYLKAIVGA